LTNLLTREGMGKRQQVVARGGFFGFVAKRVRGAVSNMKYNIRPGAWTS
jgi:hypothetical protein